jgi:hypothetical protein
VAYHGFSAMVVTKKHNNSGPATEESVLHRKNQRQKSTAIMNSSSVCHHSFPSQEDCPCVARQQDKEVQVHKSSYFVMAMAPTLVRVFLEKNKDLQDLLDNPVSSEARRQGRGGGASNGAECT